MKAFKIIAVVLLSAALLIPVFAKDVAGSGGAKDPNTHNGNLTVCYNTTQTSCDGPY